MTNKSHNRRGFALFAFFFLFIIMAGNPAAFAREMIDHPVVRLRALDKITARTMTFDASVGSTVKFGSVYIKVQACRKAPPIEQPESAAFLQIWEVMPSEEAEWVFSGWMFASSPGLSSMDHPIYDVWVLDCLEEKTSEPVEEKQDEKRPGEGEISDEQVPEKPESAMEEKSEAN